MADRAIVIRRSAFVALSGVFVASRVWASTQSAAWPAELAAVLTTLILGTFIGAWIAGNVQPRVAAEVWRTHCRGEIDMVRANSAALRYLAGECRGLVERLEAPNYVEFFLRDELGEMVLTIQKRDGKTPGELRREAEAERDQLRALLADELTTEQEASK